MGITIIKKSAGEEPNKPVETSTKEGVKAPTTKKTTTKKKAVKKKKKKVISKQRQKKLPSGATNSSVLKDKDGVPIADPPRNKSILGTLAIPDTEGKPHLEKEQLMGQVEILLLKGVVYPPHIASMLGIQLVTAKRYVEQVHYRWAILGGTPRMRQLKGEAKARLELITNELWVMHSNTKDDKVKAVCLNQLVAVHDRRLILDGLTPKTLPLIAETEIDGAGGESVSDKIKNHQEMVRLAAALVKYADKKPDAIVEADFEEIPDKKEK